MRKRQWLTEIRRQQKITLRELASELGYSYPYLSDIERGRRNPSGKLAFMLAKKFGFDMNKFFEENISA
jgi:putative transcriptional regulator